jgi:hypothetical protein
MKYQLKFKLDNIPGVGTMEMIAGQCETLKASDAGLRLENILQKRIGVRNYKNLSSATIVDVNGKDCAILRNESYYDPYFKCTYYKPQWGQWLNIYD